MRTTAVLIIAICAQMAWATEHLLDTDIVCPYTDQDDNSFVIQMPSRKSCSVFYKCNRGVPMMVECSAGLYYNTRINACDFPERAHCVLEMEGGILVVQTLEAVRPASAQLPVVASPLNQQVYSSVESTSFDSVPVRPLQTQVDSSESFSPYNEQFVESVSSVENVKESPFQPWEPVRPSAEKMIVSAIEPEKQSVPFKAAAGQLMASLEIIRPASEQYVAASGVSNPMSFESAPGKTVNTPVFEPSESLNPFGSQFVQSALPVKPQTLESVGTVNKPVVGSSSELSKFGNSATLKVIQPASFVQTNSVPKPQQVSSTEYLTAQNVKQTLANTAPVRPDVQFTSKPVVSENVSNMNTIPQSNVMLGTLSGNLQKETVSVAAVNDFGAIQTETSVNTVGNANLAVGLIGQSGEKKTPSEIQPAVDELF